jgi:hypothetical protein
MSNRANTPMSARRLLRLASLAVLIVLGLFLLSLASMFRGVLWSYVKLWIPEWVSAVLERIAWLLVVAVLSVPLTLKPRRIAGIIVPPGFWDRLDGSAGWVLRGRLAIALAVVCVLLLVTWVPHYLTWPWWADTDYFAVSAQAWASGILPYRDLFDFNFPGPTYVHWVIGKTCGWGHTVPYNALDAFLLIAFGVGLAVWSRDRFGSTVPGLVGYLAVLCYYLELDYSLVAQRDWHATLLVALGLFALEARRDRVGLVMSGLTFAFALTIRPHPIVFLPAVLSAIDENARQADEPWSRTIKAIAIWSGVVMLGMLAGAAPVVLAGVGDDFVRWSRLAWFGGDYNRVASRNFAGVLLSQLGRWQTDALLIALAALMCAKSPGRRAARTWLLALVSVLFYRPLSPVLHAYLDEPLMLVASVALAIPAGWVVTSPRLRPMVRVLAIAWLVSQAFTRVPLYCRGEGSVRAIGDLVRGRSPMLSPPGCESFLDSRRSRLGVGWVNYSELLAYLRTNTRRQTFVGNFVRDHPFPTINGPVGRLPLFPSPGGVLWLRFAAPGLERPFADALTRRQDAVVVWTPNLETWEDTLRLKSLEQIIRREYKPEAKFGGMEVWRRKEQTRDRGP